MTWSASHRIIIGLLTDAEVEEVALTQQHAQNGAALMLRVVAETLRVLRRCVARLRVPCMCSCRYVLVYEYMA